MCVHSLEQIKRTKEFGKRNKSGIMLGLGETQDEVFQAMDDLVANGLDVLTLGQYLQPTKMHHEVIEWIHPDTFAMYKEEGLKRGLAYVESGALVRSSYHAERHTYIIAGGGMSGLSLAYYLAESKLRFERILIIDQGNEAPKTWCYWSDNVQPFDAYAEHTWKNLSVHTFANQQLDLQIDPFVYRKIESSTWTKAIKEKLQNNSFKQQLNPFNTKENLHRF
jgi:hypothetical protein